MLFPILLIDDDPINNELNEKLFKKVLGRDRVMISLNGYEALDYLEKYYSKIKAFPKYIFIDIRMPGIDGFEFIEKLNQTYPIYSEVCLIILTNSLHREDRIKAKELRVHYYIEKPLTVEKIKSIIETPLPDFFSNLL